MSATQPEPKPRIQRKREGLNTPLPNVIDRHPFLAGITVVAVVLALVGIFAPSVGTGDTNEYPAVLPHERETRPVPTSTANPTETPTVSLDTDGYAPQGEAGHGDCTEDETRDLATGACVHIDTLREQGIDPQTEAPNLCLDAARVSRETILAWYAQYPDGNGDTIPDVHAPDVVQIPDSVARALGNMNDACVESTDPCGATKAAVNAVYEADTRETGFDLLPSAIDALTTLSECDA